LDFAIQTVVGIKKMSWVAKHIKAIGAVLQEAKFEKSKHITREAHNKIVDRIFQVLQED
jgi:hypothetical protein